MVDYLIVVFTITLIYFASAERLIIYINLLAIQGLLLCGIAVFELTEVDPLNLLLIVSETLLIKALLVPFMLKKIMNRSGVVKVHRQAMPGFYLLIILIAGLFSSVIIADSIPNPYVTAFFMAVSFFTLFTGLLLIVTHKLIISHITGFLILENAVFLFSIAVGNEMPMMINIGILLDIFVGVLIIGYFGLRLKPRTNELTMLKD